jgi:hypothetical protein
MDGVAIHDEIKLKITGNKEKSYIASNFMRVKVVTRRLFVKVGSDG